MVDLRELEMKGIAGEVRQGLRDERRQLMLSYCESITVVTQAEQDLTDAKADQLALLLELAALGHQIEQLTP